jgi:putative spermidine/putrescine transport system permease protein
VNGLVRGLFMALVGLFMAAPLIVVSGISFNVRKRLFFPPEGFSLRWYGEMVSQRAWLDPIFNSLVIAVSAATIAVSVALPLAYFLWAYNVRYARLLYALGVAPFLLPPIITALGFLIFWASIGRFGQIENTIMSHGIFLVTLPLITISLGLETIERELIEAARTMGGDARQVFRTIVLPLVRPYIISGFAFAFVISLNEYIIAYMVAGFTVETLPIKIFNSLRYGYTPVMGAVAVVFVLVAVTVFGFIARFGDLPKLLGKWSPDKG